MSKINRLKSNSQHAKDLKCNLQNQNETLYQPLEAILKQMLRVWAKENVAIRNISGKKSGNHWRNEGNINQNHNSMISVQFIACS